MERFFKAFCIRTSRHRQVGPIHVKDVASSALPSSQTSSLSDDEIASDWNSSSKINPTKKPYTSCFNGEDSDMNQPLHLKKSIKPKSDTSTIHDGVDDCPTRRNKKNEKNSSNTNCINRVYSSWNSKELALFLDRVEYISTQAEARCSPHRSPLSSSSFNVFANDTTGETKSDFPVLNEKIDPLKLVTYVIPVDVGVNTRSTSSLENLFKILCSTCREGNTFTGLNNHCIEGMKENSTAVLSVISELVAFATVHGGITDISCLYRLSLFDMIMHHLQGLFARPSTRDECFDIFFPALTNIMDCLAMENTWIVAEDDNHEMTDLVWIQLISRIQCTVLPLFSENCCDQVEITIVKTEKLFRMLDKLVPLVCTAHRMEIQYNAFMSLQIIFWSTCKNFVHRVNLLSKKLDEQQDYKSLLPKSYESGDVVNNLDWRGKLGEYLSFCLQMPSVVPPEPSSLFADHNGCGDANNDDSRDEVGCKNSLLAFICFLQVIESLASTQAYKIPNYQEWLMAAGRALLNCLDIKSSNEDNKRHDKIKYSVLLAKVLLGFINFKGDTLSDVGMCDGLFYDLTKKLMNYTEMIRRHRPFDESNLMSFETDPRVAENSSIINSNSNNNSFNNNSLNSSSGSNNNLSSASSVTNTGVVNEDLKFKIGDMIDGMCTLSNGSMRWFPGVIEAVIKESEGVHDHVSYTVLYQDGDIHDKKPASEIRMSKRHNRNKKNARNLPKQQQSSKSLSSTYSSPTGLRSLDSDGSFSAEIPLFSESQPVLTSPNKSREKTDVKLSDENDSNKNNIISNSIDVDLAALGVQTARSEDVTEGGNASLNDDDDDDLHFFEIPSVFADSDRATLHASQSKTSLIPLMQLDDLSYTGQLDPNNNSLSASLLRNSSSEEILAPSTLVSSTCSFQSPPGTAHESSARSMWNSGRLVVPRIDSSRSRTGRNSEPTLSGYDSVASNTTKISSHREDDGSKVGSVCTTQRMGSRHAHDASTRVDDRNSCRKHEGRSYLSVASELNDAELVTLSKTFCIITAILLDRAVHFMPECSSSNSDAGGTASLTLGYRKKNILFAVRDFLSTIVGQYFYRHYCMLCSMQSPAHTRMMKLLSELPMNSCISSHVRTSVRIGVGAFGSISRVVCPSSCPLCMRKDGDIYAVKRIGREGAAEDVPTILNVFNEVSCLEILAGKPGVCRIRDFGIEGADYCILMECGSFNLAEWRQENFGAKLSTIEEYLHLLLIYQDLILVIKSVHAADVIHFDIKCCNFIIRDKTALLNIDFLINSLSRGEPSGLFFLCDFGESLPNFSQIKNMSGNSLLARSRGTLSIQSPEMLSLSESSLKLKVSSDQSNRMEVSDACDVWSMGCLLAELLSGEYLFAERTWPDLYVSLCLSTEIDLPLKNLRDTLVNLDYRVPRFVEKLVTSILKRDPESRLGFDAQIEKINVFLKETNLLNIASFAAHKVQNKCKLAVDDSICALDENKFSISSPLDHIDPQELFVIPRCVLMIRPVSICLNLGFDCGNIYNVNMKLNKLMEVSSYADILIKGKESIKYLQAISSISQCSYESHRSCLSYFCSTQDFIEVRLVHGSVNSRTSTSNQPSPIELDVSVNSCDENFRAQWRKTLLQCKAIKSKLLITLVQDSSAVGNESPGKILFNKEGNGIGTNGMIFTSLNDDPLSNCTCSRFALTCATVLAGYLAIDTIDGDSGKKPTPMNPLGVVDRVLPGISQLCDFDLCKKLLDLDDVCEK